MAHYARAWIFAAVLGAIGAAPAQAANWFEQNFWLSGPRYDAVVPLCEERGPLAEIASAFAIKEGRFWNSRLQIVAFEQVRETAFMPWQRGARDAIPRRFCSAVAMISDGIRRPVYYSIVESGGTIGATWGVEWCVRGLDRNWAYNPGCRMARP
jgi:hypothetical protein